MVMLFTFLFLAVFALSPTLPIDAFVPGWAREAVVQIERLTGIHLVFVIVSWLFYLILLAVASAFYRILRRRLPDQTYALERALNMRREFWLGTFAIALLAIVIVAGLLTRLLNTPLMSVSLILLTGLLIEARRKGVADDLLELRAEPGPNRVVLRWEPPRGRFIGLAIRRCQADQPSPTPFVGGVQVYSGAGTSFTDENVSPGGQFYYWAFVRDGHGFYSRGVQTYARVPEPPPNVLDLTAIPEEEQIVLRWRLQPSPAVKGVRVVRREDAPPAGADDGTVIFDELGESCVDNQVDQAHDYYYYAVHAHDGHGQYSSGLRLRAGPLGQIDGDLDSDAIADHEREEEIVRADCPLCGQPVYELDIADGGAVLCPVHTYVHRICWEAYGGCPIIGCPHGPS